MLPRFQNKETGEIVTGLRIGKTNRDIIFFNEKGTFPINHEGIALKYPDMQPGQIYIIHSDDSRTIVDAEVFHASHQPVPTT